MKETEIINEVKTYLQFMRTLVREKNYLKIEYEELLSITSPSLEELKTHNQVVNSYMNSLIIKREILLKKINIINSYIFELEIATTKLLVKHRKIIQIYLEANNEIEKSIMIEELKISKSTYNRYLKEACLELSKLVDYKTLITLENINKEI